MRIEIVGAAYAATDETTQSETGADGHGGGESGAFPPFDPTYFASQLLWLAITFGIFYLIMSRVALPRIASILETRRDRISQDLDEAQRLKEESDAAYAAYEHELAEARNRAHQIAQEARDAAKAKADRERETVERQLAEQMAEAEAKIAGIKEKALSEVGSIAEETAALVIREIAGADATKAELSRAVSGARD